MAKGEEDGRSRKCKRQCGVETSRLYFPVRWQYLEISWNWQSMLQSKESRKA